MRTRLLPAVLAGALSWIPEALASEPGPGSHARTHAWHQEQGNLVPNWSFENELDTWFPAEAFGGMASDPRHSPSGFTARSGAFTGRVQGTASTSSPIALMRSQKFEVSPGQAYTLSFYVRSAGGVTGNGHPGLYLHPDESGHYSYSPGPAYATFSGSGEIPEWTLYTHVFTIPAGIRYAHVTLWRSVGSGASADLYFDEVVVEEGALDSATVADRRKRHGYSVSFSDALGRTRQSHTRLPEGDYRVEAIQYDSAGRPGKTFLPFVAPGDGNGLPTFHPDPLSAANAYYYYQSPTPGMDGVPFSEMRYAPEPGPRVIRFAFPGSAWAMDEGRNTENGYCFVAKLVMPSLPPCSFTDPGEKEFRLDWHRDEDSTYSLSWVNRRGQVVQSAVQAEGEWAVTKTDYYPAGHVRRIRTPLDTSGSTFSEVFNYDAAGNLTSRFDPDRGLVKFWYNKRGLPRYSQTETQRTKSAQLFGYTDYDDFGNPVSAGEQVLYYPIPNQEEWVDGNGEGYPHGKTEHRGWLYGSLDEFESRTGLSLDSVPGSDVMDQGYRAGSLRAAWHRNVASRAPGLAATGKLVVDFQDSDARGNVSKRHKYIGTMPDSPLLTVEYAYDASDRPTQRRAYPAAEPHNAILEQAYAYDGMGRVRSITALEDTVARYEYFGHGPLREVGLGRDGGEAGTLVNYAYHARGWMRDIGAVRGGDGRSLWRQSLGYETEAVDGEGAPPLIAPRYTGHITQQVYHYSDDIVHPVRAVNYAYDRMGRLTTADSRHGSSLDASGGLAFPLSFSDADDLDARLAYDLNGRILGKRSGGVSAADSAVYNYAPGSYRLLDVSGKLSPGRDASGFQNFAYDTDGRMTEDRSKKLRITYAYDGMPVEMAIREGEKEVVLHPLYDAAGQRVTQVTSHRRARGFPVYWVGQSEAGEPGDLYDAPTLMAALEDVHDHLSVLNAPAPDSLVFYVTPSAGTDTVLPETEELIHIFKGDTAIPVILRGVKKESMELTSRMNGAPKHPPDLQEVEGKWPANPRIAAGGRRRGIRTPKPQSLAPIRDHSLSLPIPTFPPRFFQGSGPDGRRRRKPTEESPGTTGQDAG